MKKVERINLIMRYINNRAHFTVSEIMREFSISRSTAIRDIREIESMGMPLVSEVGRDGGYAVMHNSLLPEVRFTDNEVKALFIAFLATRNQQLPYLKSRQSIAEKLLSLISENQQDDLIFLNKILLFEGTNPHNPDILELSDIPDPILEKLFLTLLLDRYFLITIQEDNVTKSYPIFLLHLYQENGNWFLEGFDLKEEKKRIISINHLTDVKNYSSKKALSEQEIVEKLSEQDEEVNIILELGPKAINQFKKYHPFKITISYVDPYQSAAILKTFVDVYKNDEVDGITNWILFLGDDIKIRELPEVISKKLQQRVLLYCP
ncbi:helix-turn-helix transcriptional regulator [Oceanobacillus picturae]|uniref:helix-turn-helix transcriptional regulator n=1 Tax=Oceanobacillus picturae TaxID=171693 RepID=UPI000E6862AA|nr:HTH domain-containing protein [Oceanobacillus picturae]RIU91352.1 HTH domain-containing protein [Oceanobacillus picturae]